MAWAAFKPLSFISTKRSSRSKHSSQPISTSRVSAISPISALKMSRSNMSSPQLDAPSQADPTYPLPNASNTSWGESISADILRLSLRYRLVQRDVAPPAAPHLGEGRAHRDLLCPGGKAALTPKGIQVTKNL